MHDDVLHTPSACTRSRQRLASRHEECTRRPAPPLSGPGPGEPPRPGLDAGLEGRVLVAVGLTALAALLFAGLGRW